MMMRMRIRVFIILICTCGSRFMSYILMIGINQYIANGPVQLFFSTIIVLSTNVYCCCRCPLLYRWLSSIIVIVTVTTILIEQCPSIGCCRGVGRRGRSSWRCRLHRWTLSIGVMGNHSRGSIRHTVHIIQGWGGLTMHLVPLMITHFVWLLLLLWLHHRHIAIVRR